MFPLINRRRAQLTPKLHPLAKFLRDKRLPSSLVLPRKVRLLTGIRLVKLMTLVKASARRKVTPGLLLSLFLMCRLWRIPLLPLTKMTPARLLATMMWIWRPLLQMIVLVQRIRGALLWIDMATPLLVMHRPFRVMMLGAKVPRIRKFVLVLLLRVLIVVVTQRFGTFAFGMAMFTLPPTRPVEI